MRKFIILLLMFVCVGVNAQVVMGINIKTTMKSFSQQMLKKGYKPIVSSVGKHEFMVTFAGYPDCRYVVEYNAETDSIFYATIYFPHQSVDKDGEIYRDMRRQLTAKYGEPTSCFETMFKDSPPHVIARLTYRDATFNGGSPYICWDFEREKRVYITYQTGARRKPSKVVYSNDL